MPRVSIRTPDIGEAVTAIAHARLRNASLAPPGFDWHPATQDFRGRCRVTDLADVWLHGVGADHLRSLDPAMKLTRAMELSREIEAGRRDAPAGSSSFAGLLANVFSVAAGVGWTKVRHTWRQIARTGSVSDFRRASRATVTEVQLTKVAERGQLPYSQRTDLQEYIVAAPFAAMFGVSRAALLADEPGALEDAAIAAGVAASASVNSGLFSMLVSNAGVGPTLNQDSLALFHSTHGNYLASGSGAAPSVTTLSAARKAMRRQTDPQTGRRINIRPAILLVPPSLEAEARVLAAADAIPGQDDGLRVVVEAALEDATGWYLLADPTEHDTLEAAFLDGADQPYVEARSDFDRDGVAVKVRLDFGVAALDFRGMYRNAGV